MTARPQSCRRRTGRSEGTRAWAGLHGVRPRRVGWERSMRVHFVGEADDGVTPSSHNARALASVGVETRFDPPAIHRQRTGWRSPAWQETCRWADVIHVVAAHHGQQGPVRPRTIEALIVSVADLADSDLNRQTLRAAEYLIRETRGGKKRFQSSEEVLNILKIKADKGWEGLKLLQD